VHFKNKNMTKTIITPQNNTYTLAIPNNYIGKKLEILVYALDEVAEEQNLNPKKVKLSDKYKGVFSMKDAKSFDEHTQQMRTEWNNI
jgi:hypothetical protein